MSNKVTCPACGVHSSDVFMALERWEPCPFCGLPAEATISINNARARGADKMLTDRVAEMEVELARVTVENTKLKNLVEYIKESIEETL